MDEATKLGMVELGPWDGHMVLDDLGGFAGTVMDERCPQTRMAVE